MNKGAGETDVASRRVFGAEPQRMGRIYGAGENRVAQRLASRAPEAVVTEAALALHGFKNQGNRFKTTTLISFKTAVIDTG